MHLFRVNPPPPKLKNTKSGVKKLETLLYDKV